MAAQQKPKPTHAIEEPLPPPPPTPQASIPQSTTSPSPLQQTTGKVPSSGGKVLAAPAVRKIAMEHNVRRIFLIHQHFSAISLGSCQGFETLKSQHFLLPYKKIYV